MEPATFPRIRPMGDAALLIELGDTLDITLNQRVHALGRALQSQPGISAIIPAYTTLLLEYDPETLAPAALEDALAQVLERIATVQAPSTPRTVEIPTRYGGEHGPDLAFVAAHNDLTPTQVIELHTSIAYQVFMIGFAPGFTYLGILPEAIAAPRLETPRQLVPAGSVGIAGRQTGIYPRPSPGGWRLIGHTDVNLFDPNADPPTLLSAGDLVRFVALT